ncbi:LADA_0C01926g1_1 [Lachancea dasiensis]|uniref:L-2-hydroxyglutarate dehydrogenase, mitochondrial n=1 Tax=Lachancea dasiensis TaxID=1072105 RepID=A0A1G4IXW0_9SACH|nr:LADA_0C01926g1_1 [Lachancea dasiensis]
MLKSLKNADKTVLANKRITFKRGLATSRTLLTAADFSHAIVGGGVIGLSIAFELSKIPSNRIVLIEKNVAPGLETSSRNSEVVHAGLYYPLNSLKTKFCLEGNAIIHHEMSNVDSGVEWKNCGKWIVAQTEEETAAVEALYKKATQDLELPVELITGQEAKLIEPHVSVRKLVLNSPTSSIIDSHSLMRYLVTNLDNNGAEIAIGTELIDMDHVKNMGYSLLCKSTVNNSDETVSISVENVVNAGGLYAHNIANMLLPKHRKCQQFFGKGNYFSLVGSKFPSVNRLIYPVPPKNGMSLGTHLTLDMNGQIRFGPDLEFVNDPTDYDVSCSNVEAASTAIRTYFPHITSNDLQPAYSGIRPKLSKPGDREFKDFYICEEDGFPGFVNLLGIESPGLTSSLAIGRYVRKLYHG